MNSGVGTSSVVALRGAITVARNSEEAILQATRELLQQLQAQNGFEERELISALFTLTPDLNAAFPARAAREMGWNGVPMLCTTEIDVPGALPHCVRVMLQLRVPNGFSPQHVYLREAAKLRPDLSHGKDG